MGGWAGSSVWYERLIRNRHNGSSYEEWLYKQHSKTYAKEILRLSEKHGYVLKHTSRISDIMMLSQDGRRMAMAALANLSKFNGCYKEWKNLRENSGLKWQNKPSLDIVLDILNSPLKDIMAWLKEVLMKLPKEYGVVLVFNALTGLRVTEGVNACKLISELSEQRKLDTYLNKELMMLEHFRFKKMFLRRNKNAYISFLTPDMLNLVLEHRPRIEYLALDTRIGRLGLPNRTSELRKYFGTVLREILPTEAIDFLQGRISASVFAKYYYKPFLVDIRTKVMAKMEPLQKELVTLLS